MSEVIAAGVKSRKTEPNISAPQRIGRFVVREEIGRGSNGVVYAAFDPVLGREVAIKAIPLEPDKPGFHEIEKGFLQEAKIAAGLNHPGIVTIFDAGRSESVAYIAMERLTGLDLHHWLAQHRNMPPETAAALIARVSDAVHFAHRRGLIHRDIKPSNIFLGRDQKPKVLDFGIALAQAKQAAAAESGKLIGTPNYMSPEQAMGRPLDARSDIFSIGAILYELVTGRRAFDGANIDEILTKVVKVNPPPLTHWRADTPAALEHIVARALAKNPDDRYQTAGHLRTDLAAYAGRMAGIPGAMHAFSARLPRTRTLHKRKALLALGGAALATAIFAGLWVVGQHFTDTPEAPVPAAPVVVAPAAPALAPKASPENTPAALALNAALASAAARANAKSAGAAPAKPAPAAHPHRNPAAVRPKEPEPVVAAVAPPPAPVPAEPGTITLAIVPWGEVLVDGNSAGISPPLNHLELSPGPHFIAVRNGALPAYSVQVDVVSGKTAVVQHHF